MRAFVTAIVVTGLAAAGARTHADPPPAGASPVETEALGHLDRGVAAYRAGDYTLAEHELHAAQQLVPDRANPYRWLALTEAALGECPAALIDVESFLSRIAADDPRVAEMVQLRQRCVLELHAKPAPETAHAVGPAAAPAGPAPSQDTPITHRWWLWAAVGAVAVTAASVTYAAVHDSGPPQLHTVTCSPTGCTM